MYNWKNFPWNQYPWTNFNELNLDWIMRLLKEIQVEAIPALDEKIDNVYEYIRENLPDIISSIVSVVIDVKEAGATGDGVTDDSAAIENALNMGSVLFFPEGTYRFKDIEVNKPVYIVGNHASWIPIHKHPNTNQSHNMMRFYDHTFIQGITFDHDNSVVSQSGTKYQTESAIIADLCECLIFEDCHIKNFFETYRETVSGVAFEDRYGMFLKARDCEYISFHSCEFNDFGGQELIQIAQGRNRYSQGFVSVDSCRFLDRNSGDTGSAFNVLGGTLIFAQNQGRNYNNIYTGGIDGGSLFNFMSPYVNISDNVFTDCYSKNFFDLSEGYYNKVEFAIVANNIIEGNCSEGIKAMAKEVYFRGNLIEGEKMLNTLTCNSTPTTGIPYHVDDATLYDFDVLEVTDNTFILKDNPFGLPPTAKEIPLFFGQTQDSAGTRAITKQIDIRNNNFVRNPDAVSYCCIYFFGPVESAHIVNNIFVGAGNSYPTGIPDRLVISGNDTITILNISYNVFDMTQYSDNINTFVVSGLKAFRDNNPANEYFNIAYGNNVISNYKVVNIVQDYNVNINPTSP